MSAELPVDDGRCFACGPHSAEGLRVRFERGAGDTVWARITLPPRFQGWRQTAHGGIVMMLLDEAMAHACLVIGERGVTASMQIRFRAAVPLGVPLVVTGNVKWKKRQVIGLEATVAHADGTLLASADGSFVSRGPFAEEPLGAPDLTFA